MDYIEKEPLCAWLENMGVSDLIIRRIKSEVHFPSDDVVEVKHGKWILTKVERGWNSCEYPKEYTCSECGRTEPQEEPYCHCGAKMDGAPEQAGNLNSTETWC